MFEERGHLRHHVGTRDESLPGPRLMDLPVQGLIDGQSTDVLVPSLDDP
jgi:hypothetical protein